MVYRTPIIIGNWKMNFLQMQGIKFVSDLIIKIRNQNHLRCNIVICPPVSLISTISEISKNSIISIGGQDCHNKIYGAYTGNISAPMLRDIGAKYVLLGHSERRISYQESSITIRKKALSAYNADLISVICIGETKEERDLSAALSIVKSQLEVSIPKEATYKNTIIAYEPVWAIGTGYIANVTHISEIHAEIRKHLSICFCDGEKFKIIYGGSVKPSTISQIIQIQDVDGALIGSASLNLKDFWEIITNCR